MEHTNKTDTLLQLMHHLKAVVSKCQEQKRNTYTINHKPELDHNFLQSDGPQFPRSFSDKTFMRNHTLKEDFAKYRLIGNSEDTFNEILDLKSLKVKLKELAKSGDNSSSFFSNSKQSTSKPSKPTRSVSDINPRFGDTNENFKTKTIQQMSRLQLLSFDSDYLLGRSCSKTKSNSSPDFISEKDRLAELIKVAAEENFALRDSNVKLLHQRKLQNLRIRDLKYKISLQNQKMLQQKAEERTRRGLENTVRDKQLEIQSLRHELKVAKEQVTDDILTVSKVEQLPKRKAVANITEGVVVRTQKNLRKNEDFNIRSLASKLNYLLVKLSKDAESCSSHLQFLEQKVGFLSKCDRLQQKR